MSWKTGEASPLELGVSWHPVSGQHRSLLEWSPGIVAPTLFWLLVPCVSGRGRWQVTAMPGFGSDTELGWGTSLLIPAQ